MPSGSATIRASLRRSTTTNRRVSVEAAFPARPARTACGAGDPPLSGAKDEARSGVGAQQLVRHFYLGYFIEWLARAVQRDHVIDVHILQRGDGLLHIVLFVRGEVEAADHRVQLLHARSHL